ncbi:hypothetical protein Tco_1163619 [Tanacetum coccineum]
MTSEIETMYNVPNTPHDSPLSGGYTPGIDKGRMELIQELMETCTSLTKRVLALEEAKTAQDRVITRLKLRVKRLEKKRKASTPQPMKRRLFKGRVESSDDDLDEEDASKQGRTDDKTKPMFQDSEFDELDDDMDNVEGETVNTATTRVSAVSAPVTTAGVAISTAEPRTPPTTAATAFIDKDLTIAQTLVKMRSEKAKVKGIAFSDVAETPRLNRSTTTLQPLPTIDPKDKGKGVLVEEEPEKPEKVKRRDQIESDAELAQRLHEEELAELDRAQKERQKQEEATSAALAEEFDKIQARIDVDHELAVRLTHEEQEKHTIEERARLLEEFFERRKKQLAAEKAEAIRNKPPTRTQVKNRMITDLKHMATTTAAPAPPPPPENFSGGLFRPNPKRFLVTRSTRSPMSRATTRRHDASPSPPHTATATISSAIIIITTPSTSSSSYHHHHPTAVVTTTPPITTTTATPPSMHTTRVRLFLVHHKGALVFKPPGYATKGCVWLAATTTMVHLAVTTTKGVRLVRQFDD